jgi:hypothetical protein
MHVQHEQPPDDAMCFMGCGAHPTTSSPTLTRDARYGAMKYKKTTVGSDKIAAEPKHDFQLGPATRNPQQKKRCGTR